MLKAIFLLTLAIVGSIIIVPPAFVVQTFKTAFFSGGIKAGWNGVANYFEMVAKDGFDQNGATVIFKIKDLTISSFTFILCEEDKMCWFRKFVDFFFGKNHCEISAKNELAEMQESIKILKKALT